MTEPTESVLANRIDVDKVTTQKSNPPQSFTYYHAGPLFSMGDLQTNIRLSSAIRRLSNGRYQAVLPQDIEMRDTSPHAIRDQDIRALLSCDLALFTYDGVELDSGTVVEYTLAKFADIPAVILRSDFRGAGDQDAHQGGGDPWNLMCSSWPRTARVVVNGMVEYKAGLGHAQASLDGQISDNAAAISERAGEWLLESTAKKVVEAFDQVLAIPARLPIELRDSVYTWLALMPTFKDGSDGQNTSEMLQNMQGKIDKGLL